MNALQSGAFFFTPTTLMPLIVADFSLPLSLSTVPIAIGKIAYVLLLIPGGMLVDRFGPRVCVFLGVFGLALFMTMYAIFVSSFSFLVVIHVLLATVASVSGVPVYSIFVAQWFQTAIGLAMGLVLAGYSAAGTAIPALLGPIAAAFGWRVAMGVTCVLLWCVALPVTFFFLHENCDAQTDFIAVKTDDEQCAERTPFLSSEQREQDEDVMMGLEHNSWTFVGFAFSYILLQYCFGCFSENLMFLLTLDNGMSLSVASLFFSILNLSSFSAKLVGGHLGDRFDRFHVASASSGLAAVGILFLFMSPPSLGDDNIPHLTSSPLAFLLFTILFGFGYGATFNSLYALTPIVFGKRNLGRTQSALFGLGLTGNAVGSVLTGVLRSRYGSYERAFLVSAVACIANFFVFNLNRLTLGGSVEGLKRLNEEQRNVIRSGALHGMEELEVAEAAAQQRVGLLSNAASPNMSPTGSMSDEQGVDFIFGSGIQTDNGFPIARDWSSSSLRNELLGGRTRLESAARRAGRMRRSSTFEAMIDSGIISASLESAGYLGKKSRISRRSSNDMSMRLE